MDPFRRKIVKGVVIAELIAFGVTYKAYHGMNTDQEYRKWMHQNYPAALTTFYRYVELTSGESEVKYKDYKAWGLLDENDLLKEIK